MGRCCVIRGYVWALYEGVFREMSLYEELLEFQNDADVERAIQESENDGLENDAQDVHNNSSSTTLMPAKSSTSRTSQPTVTA